MSALLLVALAGQPQQRAQEDAAPLALGSAVIADLKGEVALHTPDGSALVAQKGQTLAADTTIETKTGSVLLNLADGSQVLIKPHTRTQLQAPEKAKGNFLQLFLGNVVAKVQKRLGIEPSFRMGTPTAVITVRGTHFSVEVTKKNKTIIEVFDGLVEVTALAAPGHPVMIRPGFSTQVGIDGAPDNPRSLQAPGAAEGSDSEHIGPPEQRTSDQGERPESTSPAGRQSSGGERPD